MAAVVVVQWVLVAVVVVRQWLQMPVVYLWPLLEKLVQRLLMVVSISWKMIFDEATLFDDKDDKEQKRSALMEKKELLKVKKMEHDAAHKELIDLQSRDEKSPEEELLQQRVHKMLGESNNKRVRVSHISNEAPGGSPVAFVSIRTPPQRDKTGEDVASTMSKDWQENSSDNSSI